MSYEIQAQVLFLITAFLLGFLIGFLFDIYRRLRKTISPGPLVTFIGDLGFWVLVTIVTFSLLYKVNFAQVRGYLFLGLGIGLIIYFSFISRHVIYIFVKLDMFFKKLFYRFQQLGRRIKKLKFFSIPRRMFNDAKRIYNKIKRR